MTRFTTPGGTPASSKCLDEVHRGQRCQRGRLEDDGVAAHECRHDLPRRNRHREIPRRDDRAHPERLPSPTSRICHEAPMAPSDALAAPLARHEVGHVDRFLDVAACLLEHLTHFAGHVARELLLARSDDRAAAKRTSRASAQAPAAMSNTRARRPAPPPRRLRDSSPGTTRLSRRDWRDFLERPAGFRRNPRPIDEIVKGAHNDASVHRLPQYGHFDKTPSVLDHENPVEVRTLRDLTTELALCAKHQVLRHLHRIFSIVPARQGMSNMPDRTINHVSLVNSTNQPTWHGSCIRWSQKGGLST